MLWEERRWQGLQRRKCEAEDWNVMTECDLGRSVEAPDSVPSNGFAETREKAKVKM
jgi:hypothetical protein